MSKAEKRLQRLASRPPPKDYTWSELVAALGSLGFELDQESGGSHCIFFHMDDEDKVIHTYRPHPDPVIYQKEIKQIVEKLEEWEML